MKQFSYLTILLFATLFLTCKNSSNAQTPNRVKETFKLKYPGENDPDWHKDANGNYESNFKIKGVKYRADFSPEGNWIETETNIKFKDLPEAIKHIIKKDFKDEKITEIEKVDSATKGLFYDVEFKQKGKNRDVEFTASGKILN